MLRFLTPLALAITAAACLPSLPSADPGEVCGDGWWSPLEACEPADPVYGPWCTAECTWHTCGDGVVGPDEACDPGVDGPADPTCATNCTRVGCGNGAADPGELCLDPHRVLSVGTAVTDVVLADFDADGDPDLLLATPEGPFGWFNDRGEFTRSALLYEAPGTVAVAALDGAVLALTPTALHLQWLRGGRFQGHTVPVEGCEAPVPGSLSAGAQGLARYAAFVCDGAGHYGYYQEFDTSPHAFAADQLGVVGARAADVSANSTPRFWFAAAEAPKLVAPNAEIALPAPAQALRGVPLVEPSRLAFAVVVSGEGSGGASDAVLGVFGAAVTAERATPGVIDGTLVWWNTESRVPDALSAVWIDAAGVYLSGPDGAVSGPALPGLRRVLVADLDGDGLLDVVGHRPEAGELHLWRQNP